MPFMPLHNLHDRHISRRSVKNFPEILPASQM
jgi:hypothetical protein